MSETTPETLCTTERVVVDHAPEDLAGALTRQPEAPPHKMSHACMRVSTLVRAIVEIGKIDPSLAERLAKHYKLT